MKKKKPDPGSIEDFIRETSIRLIALEHVVQQFWPKEYRAILRKTKADYAEIEKQRPELPDD
jgi:hypothetical protein